MSPNKSDDSTRHPGRLVRRDWEDEDAVEDYIEAIRRSSATEHFIYREAEADELWRYLEDELREEEDEDRLIALNDMKEVVMRVHDLSAEGRVEEAANALSEVWQRRADIIHKL